jgi:hypothetical protein
MYSRTNKRKPRCLKLKYKKLEHTNRLNSLNGWTDNQQAPPVTLL